MITYKFCPKCGQATQPTWSVCPYCGTSLIKQVSPQQSIPAPPYTVSYQQAQPVQMKRTPSVLNMIATGVFVALVLACIALVVLFKAISNTVPPTPTVPPHATTLILDMPGMLGKSRPEVEQVFGAPTHIQEMHADPMNVYNKGGGEARDYQYGKYGVSVEYDKQGNAIVLQVNDGLADEQYSLDQWKELLPRLGLSLSRSPDVTAPAVLRWNNVNGYELNVYTETIRDSTVRSVIMGKK